jgi:histidine triad (HIT) family protein
LPLKHEHGEEWDVTPDPDDTTNCAFCAIARGEEPSIEVVCQGESWLAFFPLNPATPGHTMVIPRQHVSDLWKVEPPLQAELMAAVIRVGRAIDSTLHPEGMNLITSAGETAEQTVFHLHLHVLPRWQRDGLGRIWPTEGLYENANLEEVAGRIRTACGATE